MVGLNPKVPHIRLIALDLDGTLLTSDKRLSPGSAEAVREALDAGVAVCLASGRALSTIVPFVKQLGLQGPIVSCNGAFVLDSAGGVLHHCTLPKETVLDVLAYASQSQVHTNLYSGGDVYFSGEGEWADVYRSRTGVKEKGIVGTAEMAGLPATKILFIDHHEGVLRHHAATSKVLGSGRATIALSEAEYIEFLPPGINKGTGVQAVASALSLHRTQVAALGDYHNDLEMVQWAGLGGAVANAVEEVREHADLVVASNDEGGAAEFIRAALRFEPGIY